jgi:hypothetical protein
MSVDLAARPRSTPVSEHTVMVSVVGRRSIIARLN